MKELKEFSSEEEYVPRSIQYIVVHCSATRANIPFTEEQLLKCHLQRGFKYIGYHFYITRDGELHHCRPVSEPGAHVRGFTSSCTKKYLDNPYLFLTNNVIRPEDLKLYEGICDNFKLVGRTIEDDILVNMIKAYGNEYYDGNLLDILDNRFQRVINIPNNKLNELIYKKMKCDKNCAKCGYCKDLYTTIQNEFV